jgi:hypothetical protein
MARIRKALLAGLGAALTGLITATVQKGAAPGWGEVWAALGLGIAAALAVYRVPNAPTPPAGVTGRYVDR